MFDFPTSSLLSDAELDAVAGGLSISSISSIRQNANARRGDSIALAGNGGAANATTGAVTGSVGGAATSAAGGIGGTNSIGPSTTT